MTDWAPLRHEHLNDDSLDLADHLEKVHGLGWAEAHRDLDRQARRDKHAELHPIGTVEQAYKHVAYAARLVVSATWLEEQAKAERDHAEALVEEANLILSSNDMPQVKLDHTAIAGSEMADAKEAR